MISKGLRVKRGKHARPMSPLVGCPHPDCNHVGDIITKAHCRMHHGMERDDLYDKYGGPLSIDIDAKKRRENYKIRTILPNNNPVITGQKGGVSRV